MASERRTGLGLASHAKVVHRSAWGKGGPSIRVLDRIRRTIRRHDLASPSTRVVVALSGGGDSVALAHLLRALQDAGDLFVAGVAHFNHQLRADAHHDEAFSRSLADQLGWPCLVEREDVARRARRERFSIEHAARNARHEFFARACAHFSGDVIALGHTRDDQAETFLLRLIRGAGPRGLSGMHPRSGRVIRPLLDCRRSELRAFLVERGLPFVDDSTNKDVAIPRNRVRAELVPLLEDRFNPSVVDALTNQADLARDEWLWMLDEIRTRNLEPRTSNEEPGVWNLERTALLTAPRALRRMALWRAMSDASGGRTVAVRHVEAALRIVESAAPAGSVDAPGHVVERIADRVVLTSGRSDGVRLQASAFFRYPLSIPGEVSLPEHGCIVSAAFATADGSGEALRARMGSRATAIVATHGWKAPLSVRNRRPGDRFRPFGLDRQKKLQDFFVDRKVARADRDRVPIVVDENDRILWVAGHEIDEAFRVTEASQAVLILTLRQVESLSGEASGGCA
jgi:tRNA(Ile)-lysidine synthase